MIIVGNLVTVTTISARYVYGIKALTESKSTITYTSRWIRETNHISISASATKQRGGIKDLKAPADKKNVTTKVRIEYGKR